MNGGGQLTMAGPQVRAAELTDPDDLLLEVHDLSATLSLAVGSHRYVQSRRKPIDDRGR